MQQLLNGNQSELPAKAFVCGAALGCLAWKEDRLLAQQNPINLKKPQYRTFQELEWWSL